MVGMTFTAEQVQAMKEVRNRVDVALAQLRPVQEEGLGVLTSRTLDYLSAAIGNLRLAAEKFKVD